MANERVINEPFDVVWDRLVRGLSRSFYVINNIEKQSRIINVSFSSDNPEHFIDCGRSVRTYHREFRGEQIDRTYEYEIAASSRFLVAGTWLFVDPYGISQKYPETTDYTRTTTLEGRVNIYVAPRNAQQTDITVNARYVLNVGGTATVERENAVGNVIQRATVPVQGGLQHSFNTNQPNRLTATDSGSHTSCHSTGRLETEILNLAGS